MLIQNDDKSENIYTFSNHKVTISLGHIRDKSIVPRGNTGCGVIPVFWHLKFLKSNNSKSYRVRSRRMSFLNSAGRGASESF